MSVINKVREIITSRESGKLHVVVYFDPIRDINHEHDKGDVNHAALETKEITENIININDMIMEHFGLAFSTSGNKSELRVHAH